MRIFGWRRRARTGAGHVTAEKEMFCEYFFPVGSGGYQ